MTVRADNMAEYGASILLIPISYDGRGPTGWTWAVVTTRDLDEQITDPDGDIESPIEAVKRAVEAFNEYLDSMSDDWEGFA